MFTLENDKVVCFDVDSTLVFFKEPDPEKHPNSRYLFVNGLKIWVNNRVENKIVQHYQRGWCVVVWSQSGNWWAKQVIEKLGLEEYVTMVLTKPLRYYDDYSSEDWLMEWKKP